MYSSYNWAFWTFSHKHKHIRATYMYNMLIISIILSLLSAQLHTHMHVYICECISQFPGGSISMCAPHNEELAQYNQKHLKLSRDMLVSDIGGMVKHVLSSHLRFSVSFYSFLSFLSYVLLSTSSSASSSSGGFTICYNCLCRTFMYKYEAFLFFYYVASNKWKNFYSFFFTFAKKKVVSEWKIQGLFCYKADIHIYIYIYTYLPLIYKLSLSLSLTYSFICNENTCEYSHIIINHLSRVRCKCETVTKCARILSLYRC
jgi:hypothetical protein